MKQTQKTMVPKLRFPEFSGAWDRRSLSAFVDPERRITYGIVQPGEFVRDGVALVRGGDYSFGWAPLDQIKRVTAEIDAPYKRSKLAEGDILLTIVGANTGTVAVVPEWLSGANITQTTARIAVDRRAGVPGFVEQALRSPIGLTEVKKYIKGAAQPGLNLSDIEKFSTPYTSLPEQQKIADFFSALDGKIVNLLRKKTLLEDYRKGCMQQLFSRSIRFKDDHGNHFPDWQSTKIGEVFSWVRTNSLSRERLTYDAGEVQNIHYGDIHTKFRPNFRQGKEEVPFVKNVRLGEFSKEDFCRLGDVVIADASEDYADIGKAIEIVELSAIPLVAGLHTFIARPVVGVLALGFSGYLLRSDSVRRQIMKIAQGISVLGVSKGNLETVRLSIPHPDEQRKIAAFLSAIDIRLELTSQELVLAQAFKSGLLQQMFV